MKNNLILLFLLCISAMAAAQDEPSWVSSFPYSANYYTGVGSSNEGNRSLDYDRALLQARLNLAAEISTKLSAETEIETYDRGDGISEQTFKEKLNQKVEQKLEGVEIVDTWYSESQGYWVYTRLLKKSWEEMKARDTSTLQERIQSLINNSYFSPIMTTAEKLNRLASASQLLQESPYETTISGKLGEAYFGNIHDFILSEIYRLSSSITITLNENPTQNNLSTGINLRVSCHSSENYTGKLPILLKGEMNNRQEFLTDINGNAGVDPGKTFFSPGRNQLIASLNAEALGFPANNIYGKRFFSPEGRVNISITSPTLYLTVQSNRNGHPQTEAGLSALFSENGRSFELSSNRETSSNELIVSLSYTDFPKVLENAPIMAGLTAVIRLKSKDRLIFEYETDPYKDGGLTSDQAYERVYRKMLEDLSKKTGFIREMEQQLNQ